MASLTYITTDKETGKRIMNTMDEKNVLRGDV